MMYEARSKGERERESKGFICTFINIRKLCVTELSASVNIVGAHLMPIKRGNGQESNKLRPLRLLSQLIKERKERENGSLFD